MELRNIIMENLHTCIPALWFGCILMRYCLNIESVLSHRSLKSYDVFTCWAHCWQTCDGRPSPEEN